MVNVRKSFISGVALAPCLFSASVLNAESAELEEVVIYGTRKSLESSLSVKRNANQIVDSLSAEGISKLPDLNLRGVSDPSEYGQVDRKREKIGEGVTLL